jgi:hypothetical protein
MEIKSFETEVKSTDKYTRLINGLKNINTAVFVEYFATNGSRMVRIDIDQLSTKDGVWLESLLEDVTGNTTIAQSFYDVSVFTVWCEEFGKPVEYLLERAMDNFHDTMEKLLQSPFDYDSDGFYDFYFSTRYKIKVEIEDEPIKLTAKLHLSVFVDEDTGMVHYTLNRIAADSQHDYIEDYPAHEVEDWSGVNGKAEALLRRIEEKTGLKFDLKTQDLCGQKCFSSINLLTSRLV